MSFLFIVNLLCIVYDESSLMLILLRLGFGVRQLGSKMEESGFENLCQVC